MTAVRVGKDDRCDINASARSVIVFDLDGTLVNTMPALTALAVDVLVRWYGFSAEAARRQYVSTCGRGFVEQLDCILPGDARNSLAAHEFERRKQHKFRGLTATPQTLTVLRQLRRELRGLAISSNNAQSIVDQFAAASSVPFDLALGRAGTIGKGRGHFDRIAARFDCALADLVFVGDSLFDGEIARQAGVRFIACLGTFSQNDFLRFTPPPPVIGSLAELPPLLGLPIRGPADAAPNTSAIEV